jgi:NAD(P) transhydrogenase
VIQIQGPNGETTCRADAFIIATGSKAAESASVPVNGRTILLSEQWLQMPDLPKSDETAIIGAAVSAVRAANGLS